LHGGTAHIAFGAGDGLGLRDFRTYAAQCPTPHNCCARFVAAVAGGNATLATGRVLALTRAGLSPAGPDQLILTHPHILDTPVRTRRGVSLVQADMEPVPRRIFRRHGIVQEGE
jgi:hypothetical protein